MSMDIPQQVQSRILVIGDSCADVYEFGSCARLSPEAPVPVLKISHTRKHAGMAANVSQNIEALSNTVFLFTNEELIIKKRIVDSKFNHHLLRIDVEPEVNPLDWKNYAGPPMESFDGFVISDYDKGFLPENTLAALITHLKSFKKPIFVDTKKTNLSYFDGCFIKINQAEFEKAQNIPESSTLIVTCGSAGAKWKDKIFPAVKTEVFDVCGAGDTFLAALVDCFLKEREVSESIRFANKCASIAVRNFGTYCLSHRDMIEQVQ